MSRGVPFNIQIIRHYAGKTPGPNGLDFGHSERDAFKEKIRPVIKTFVQKVWSKWTLDLDLYVA